MHTSKHSSPIYKRSMMRVHYLKLRNIQEYIPPPLLNIFTSKGASLYILFAITAAGVVPCGSPKSLPVDHQ